MRLWPTGDTVSLATGFIALPGGLGTLDELFEVLNWAQLGLHEKPCGLLNVSGYYDHIARFLDNAMEQRFVRPSHRSMLTIDSDPDAVLDRVRVYRAPGVDKCLDQSEA